MEYKDRIKAARKHAKLTQVELAKRVGIDQTSVSDLERGKSQSSSYNARIAVACGVNPLWLEDGIGEMVASISTANARLDAGESSEALSAEAKQGAADIVLAMLKKHAAKGMSSAAQEKIAQAVADSLAEKNVVAAPASNVIPADFSRIRPRQGELLVPQYDIRAAMGAGQLPPDYVETVRNLVVNEAHLRAHGVDYTAPENLAMITGWGQSMLGTINDKDPVMVDKGVNEFIGEGIYVLTWHEHMYIKRVQILDGDHFQLISDNDKYQMQKARVEDVIFHAKVLLIWNARKG
ncbi:helix-turn-helix domain-containing protein [Pseudomonas nitroreducens]|uniref:XRE family transcriptional regulator n=1 Tax=Pseudomonas nitroreducens TaxID=46680 RepID=UPI00244B32FD|nr:S24 family peptidase [Pseudomonas nitroreducens]MDH1074574.1 helix-turn-helix domain-containing protein [Pseudomonas nitroreducens]